MRLDYKIFLISQLLYNTSFHYTAEGQFLSIGGIYYEK